MDPEPCTPIRLGQVQYEYRLLPTARVIETLSALSTQLQDGAYIASDAETDAIREALAAGFRWIRTDGELAVFERVVPGPEYGPGALP